MKLIVGITGFPLSGKGTVADALERLLSGDGRSVSRHRFSDILRDTLDLWSLPHGRSNEQLLAQLMDRFAVGTLSRATENRLAKDSADVGILDGIRWPSDEEMVRRFVQKGIKSIVVYVAADPDIRYARLVKRNRAGEAATSREEFDRQMLQKTETYIPEIGSRADIIIENNGDDFAALQKKVEEAYAAKVRPLL